MKIGANYSRNGKCEFIVWAPFVKQVSLKLLLPDERLIPMQKERFGYWKAELDDIKPGTLYYYYLEGERQRPDPASYYQPYGVHEASQVIDHSTFKWQDANWQGIRLSEMIIYELHVGTFTPEGTFDSIISRLDHLREDGINAIEIMPVAQFPGERNWGYDGVYPFAVQNSYGGPDGLKRLVNECHKKGIAVILDVVYNHLGPEGNYLWDFGPYFTDRYKTPWGKGINFDGPGSNEVRRFFIENALYWFKYYHIDALRLDAIHGIYDNSAKHFLLELAEKVEEFSNQEGRKFYLIAESDLNNSRIIRSKQMGGYGIDASWCDDFHHSIHTILTGEKYGYYIDFGKIKHLAKSLREGFVYSGQYSKFRKRNHGNSSADLPAERFVVFSQNHDQVGNRIFGERLSCLVSFEALKLAAGTVLLSPYVPLLFMGEEYGETSPFLYFISHSDQNLIEGVRKGRKEVFKLFKYDKDPPDPQAVESFIQSRINWNLRFRGNNKILLYLYRELIRLRKSIPALANLDKNSLKVSTHEEKKIILMKRWKDDNHVLIILNFNKTDIKYDFPMSEERWQKILDSSEVRWKGPGSSLPDYIKRGGEVMVRAESFAVYVKKEK
jgi:maltooligosyltrehalose trehalohydrolase